MKVSYFVLVAFLGYGCAAKKIAIDNADTLISHQVQKRLPLKSDQKTELEKDIVKFLNNEKSQVKTIIPVIDEITLESSSNTATQYGKLEDFFRLLSKDFSAMISKHMATLDQTQQAEFFKRLEKENKRILEKDKADRLDSIENYLEHFLGKINNDQLKIITSYGDYFVESAKKRVERRKKLQNSFRETYQKESSPENRERLFQEAFVKYQDEGFKSSKNFEILDKLIPTLTKEQREKFKSKAKEINELLNYFLQSEY